MGQSLSPYIGAARFYRHFFEVPLGFLVAQSSRDGKEMPHGQAPWSCRFVPMLSALFRAAFSIRKSLRNELRRSLSRAARRIGPLAAEGVRGHGMDDPLVGMAKAPLKTLIEVCKKSV
jgi:hypothetical protein